MAITDLTSLTVVIPVHNEVGALGGVVQEVREALAQIPSLTETEILVVDDGSTDGSVEAAMELGVRVVRHPTNFGYGAAVKRGLRSATHDTIVLIDGDGTYPARYIPDLVQDFLQDCDMAVGARTGQNVAIPAERKPAKWVLQKIAEFLAGQRIPDLNSGLRVFSRSAASKFMGLYPRGFSFTTTITLAYHSSDYVVKYRPIDYRVRSAGKSKIRPLRDTQRILMTIIRSILFFNPLRVCVPLSGIFAVLAAWVLLFVRDVHGNVLDGTVEVLVMCGLQILLMGFVADILARSK